MKIKRFFAADIRQAMRMVKEELGADAVIMSNRSVDGGVEIVAARDFDEQLIHQNLQKQAAERKSKEAIAQKSILENFTEKSNPLHIISSSRKKGADGSIPPRTLSRPVNEYLGYAEKIQINRPRKLETAPETKAAASRPVQTMEEVPDQPVKPEPLKINPVNTPTSDAAADPQPISVQAEPINDSLIREMFQELKSLKMTMNSRFSEIGWQQGCHDNPARIELLRRLADMGIAKRLSIKVANRLANFQDLEPAFEKVQDTLVNALPVAHDNLLEYGGIAVLVGPTGVGKTTTIAKLAAQFILKHGPRQVALITTDNFRIAAHEQLNTYGRILDVPMRVANDAEQLRSLINGFADKRLILIDTAGMSPRDQRLAEQIKTLQHHDLPIKSYLVMSAATQYRAMREVINGFQIFQPEACILTKLDEAASKGAAISALIEQRLPLAFVTDGQQVPEDLHSAAARTLIEQCVAELDREYEDTMDMNFDDWVAQGYA
ncbi:MAG: flagellar biosynthesis protein FlhF [Gammaproteobacteria bacterium]